MKKYSNDHGTVKLIVSDNVAIIERGILSNIVFDRCLLDMYAEDYIKANFEMSDDGWIRRIENDETV